MLRSLLVRQHRGDRSLMMMKTKTINRPSSKMLEKKSPRSAAAVAAAGRQPLPLDPRDQVATLRRLPER